MILRRHRRARRSHLGLGGGRRLGRLIVFVPIATTAYLLSAGESGLFRVWRQVDRIETLHQEIATLREQNQGLLRRASLLRTDLRTIERIARERYGMVRENESVYMVYPKPPALEQRASP